jgi:uncharacterized iron-regulated protein
MIFLALSLVVGLVEFAAGHSYDFNRQDFTSLEEIIADLQLTQAVFVGEAHDNPGHHRAQLQLIRELHRTGTNISIGLEMFREEGQADLDRWVQGEISEQDFKEVFEEHWSNWPLYRDIFIYAREEQIPLLGLNIPRALVKQVARSGFNSLTPEQRVDLPLASCNVSPEYRQFIRRTLSGHPLDGTAFEYFCEAQILWDAGMAVNLEKHLLANPEQVVVVLAGSGHAWKHGMPEQLLRRGDYRTRVLLPETPGRIDLSNTGADEADYLLQGVEEGPLH